MDTDNDFSRDWRSLLLAPTITWTQERKKNEVDSIYSTDEGGELSVAVVALIQHRTDAVKNIRSSLLLLHPHVEMLVLISYFI